MVVIGNIIWGVSIFITLGWCLHIRQKSKNEQAREKALELQGFLMTVSVILIPVIPLSPFHLLWMIPASFIIGLLSMGTPLRLLWIFSSIYFSFWLIGISNVGRQYYLAGEYDKAIGEYKKEINKNPKSAEAHFNLGLAYGKVGESQKEIESYLDSVILKPTEQVYFNLGKAYSDIGSKEKAIEAFDEAIRLNNSYAKAHYMICKTYAEIGDHENAIKEYELLKSMKVSVDEELENMIKNM